jgi:hypothetical protein
MNGTLNIEEIRTELETQMLALPADKTTCDPHKMYLAGLLTAYEQMGVITPDIHDELYLEYVG